VKDFIDETWTTFQNAHPEIARSISMYSTHRGRAQSKAAILKSIKKCDVPMKCPPIDNIFYFTLEMVINYLSPFLTVTPTTSFVDCDFNFKAKPGEPYEGKGIDSKQNALFTKTFVKRFKNKDVAQYFKTFAKIELLPLIDIQKNDIDDINKIRTIFNGSFDLLAWCAELFDQQNDALIAAAGKIWSSYGRNKWQGGFNDMFKRLEDFEFIEEGDVSGYDRVAVLFIVYLIRRQCLNLSPKQEADFGFVSFYLISAFITCPDGHLYFVKFGNRSGSRNTASDNTILHIFIRFYQMITFFLKKLKRLPNLAEVLHVHYANIYSDDTISGIKLSFFSATDSEWIQHLEETYALFGMVRKPKTIKTSTFLKVIDPKHSFLGSKVRFNNRFKMYYPVPDIGKITSSLIFTCERKQLIFTVSRLMALITLVAFDDEHYEVYQGMTLMLRELVRDRLDEIPTQFHHDIIEFSSCCDKNSYFLYHYFGFESGGSNTKVFRGFKFFTSYFNTLL